MQAFGPLRLDQASMAPESETGGRITSRNWSRRRMRLCCAERAASHFLTHRLAIEVTRGRLVQNSSARLAEVHSSSWKNAEHGSQPRATHALTAPTPIGSVPGNANRRTRQPRPRCDPAGHPRTSTQCFRTSGRSAGSPCGYPGRRGQRRLMDPTPAPDLPLKYAPTPKADPVRRWHCSQWHMTTITGSPDATARRDPQLQ